MGPADTLLLAAGAILLIGAAGELAFRSTRIPGAAWLMAAGIVLGPVTGVIDPAGPGSLVPFLGSLALVVFSFDAGNRVRLTTLSQAGPRALVLALIGVALSGGAVAAASMGLSAAGLLPPGWNWTYAGLLGAALAGPGASVILPAFMLSGTDTRVASLSGGESALSDAISLLAAVVLLGVLAGAEPKVALGSVAAGLGLGLVAGLLWLLFLRVLQAQSLAYPITLALLMVLFFLMKRFGGEPAAGILAIGVVLGNAPSISRALSFPDRLELDRQMLGFHSQAMFLVRAFLFTWLGLVMGPPWGPAVAGLLLALALFAIRIPTVAVASSFSDLAPVQRGMLAVLLPRGVAAGVVATAVVAAAAAAPAEGSALASVAGAATLLTLVGFAFGYPFVLRRATTAPSAYMWAPTGIGVPEAAKPASGFSAASAAPLTANVAPAAAWPAPVAPPTPPAPVSYGLAGTPVPSAPPAPDPFASTTATPFALPTPPVAPAHFSFPAAPPPPPQPPPPPPRRRIRSKDIPPRPPIDMGAFRW